ncbi:large-conductance mechanosensitive channel [Striga asiatica]|uniref:Large-conductance mechanosensitive channel n=1 Tax=Striga asiatica TaxID=4170 RepID=A0A5A7Q2A6_STRAF|nr:large-conductance mechanosensitive channel [Striga asiatica]
MLAEEPDLWDHKYCLMPGLTLVLHPLRMIPPIKASKHWESVLCNHQPWTKDSSALAWVLSDVKAESKPKGITAVVNRQGSFLSRLDSILLFAFHIAAKSGIGRLVLAGRALGSLSKSPISQMVRSITSSLSLLLSLL